MSIFHALSTEILLLVAAEGDDHLQKLSCACKANHALVQTDILLLQQWHIEHLRFFVTEGKRMINGAITWIREERAVRKLGVDSHPGHPRHSRGEESRGASVCAAVWAVLGIIREITGATRNN